MHARIRLRRMIGVSTLILLAVAAGLVQQWPGRGMWYDETVNAYFAEHGLGDVWSWCTAVDNQMPLDFVLRNLWGHVVGTSEFALRAYSVEFALLSVAGVIALGRRVGRSPAAGWVAGIAYALSQGFLYAAFEVRPYALALALFAWSSVVLWEFWSRYVTVPRPPDSGYLRLLVLYGMLALGILYTHYTGFFALAAHGMFVGADALRQRTRRHWLALGLIGVGLGAGYIPWMVAIAGRDIRAGTAYEARIKPLQAFKAYIEFYAHGQHVVTPDTPPYAWVLASVVLASAVLWMLADRRRLIRWRGFFFALAVTVVPLIMLMVMVYAVQAKLSGRHGWPMWIGAALLVGGVFAALDGLRWRRMLALVVVLVTIWLPGRANLQPTYNSYLREAFAYINAHAEPGDVLVLRDGTLFTAADYYDAAIPWVGIPAEKLTNVNRFLFFREARVELDRIIREHEAQRVWVVTWQGDIMDPQNLVNGLLETIGDPQPLEGSYGFGDVSVLLYALHDPPDILDARIETLTPLVETPGGGPVLYGGYVLNTEPVPHGGLVLVHTWWRRGEAIMPDMRVSVRLYDSAGMFYTQIDQPPVRPSFGQEHWAQDDLLLSRFALWVPGQMPPGMAEVKLLIYHMQNEFDPITVPLATVEIRD